MSSGFAQLSAVFFSEILSRKRQRAVRVASLRVADYTPPAARPQGSAALKKVEMDTDAGPVELIVKVLAQPHDREALVWRLLAKLPEAPVPEIHHVEHDGSWGTYGVILEYVPPLAEAERWDPAQCRRIGLALARFHAIFWGRPDQVPAFLHTDDARLAPEKVEPAVRRFLDRITARKHAALSAVVPDVFAFLAKLIGMDREFFDRADPLRPTLIHAALRRSEVLLRPGSAPLEPVLIDWERARLGTAAEDLAALTASLDPADRPSAAEALLDGYVEGLTAAGVACETPVLKRELLRRRVLLVGAALPGDCRLYVQREGDPAHHGWCARFIERTHQQVAEARGLLETIAEMDAI